MILQSLRCLVSKSMNRTWSTTFTITLPRGGGILLLLVLLKRKMQAGK